jgi:glycosyltransferase involved in cell wall biosynthesis
MAGDGPLRCDARALATRLNLDDRVTFPGWIGAVEAHRLLNTAAVLCMPSRSEGLPMVAIEAISAGCALVCSAIPGMRGVAVGGGNAWLFPPGSIRDATDCLATAIGNRADMERRRMESLLIAKAFEAPAIVAAYEALFYKAC